MDDQLWKTSVKLGQLTTIIRLAAWRASTLSLRIPIRMRRPTATREALSFSPVMEASWADSSRVECVPFVAAGAEPLVFFAGRPATERAADTRGVGVLLLFEVEVWNDDRIVRDRTHARYYDLDPDPSGRANQPNGAASTKRVLNLRDGIRCANQVINGGLWSIRTYLNAVIDVACWFAGVSECARYFHLDILNINAALCRLTIKIIAETCRESGEQ